jgi:hypothetical protein
MPRKQPTQEQILELLGELGADDRVELVHLHALSSSGYAALRELWRGYHDEEPCRRLLARKLVFERKKDRYHPTKLGNAVARAAIALRDTLEALERGNNCRR